MWQRLVFLNTIIAENPLQGVFCQNLTTCFLIFLIKKQCKLVKIESEGKRSPPKVKKERVSQIDHQTRDIYYADLSPVVGSEQGGLRPVLIVQNDVGNRYSPTVIAAAITSQLGKAKLPTHIDVYAEKYGLVKDSVILLEQIRTIDKTRLREKMGHLDDVLMQRVNNAITVSFGLDEGYESMKGQADIPAAAEKGAPAITA